MFFLDQYRTYLQSRVLAPFLHWPHESVPGGACDCRGNVNGSLDAHVHSDKSLIVYHPLSLLGEQEGSEWVGEWV